MNHSFKSEPSDFSWFPSVTLFWGIVSVFVPSVRSGGADPRWRPRPSTALTRGAAATGGAGGEHLARAPPLSQGRHKAARHWQALPDLQQARGHWGGGLLLHVSSCMINACRLCTLFVQYYRLISSTYGLLATPWPNKSNDCHYTTAAGRIVTWISKFEKAIKKFINIRSKQGGRCVYEYRVQHIFDLISLSWVCYSVKLKKPVKNVSGSYVSPVQMCLCNLSLFLGVRLPRGYHTAYGPVHHHDEDWHSQVHSCQGFSSGHWPHLQQRVRVQSRQRPRR